MVAFGVWIACPSHRTLADSSVALWGALSAGSTGVIRILAGVLALAIQAGLSVGALRV